MSDSRAINLPKWNSDETLGQRLVNRCGGYQQAIDAVMTLARVLRGAAFLLRETLAPPAPRPIFVYGDDVPNSSHERRAFYWEIKFDELERTLTNALPSHDPELSKTLLEHLQYVGLVRAGDGTPTGRLKRSAVQPVTLARELLKDVRPDHELRYYVMSNIRRHWAWPHSSEAAHEIHVLTDLLNNAIKLRANYARSGYVNRWDSNGSSLNRLWAGVDGVPGMNEVEGMADRYRQKIVSYHVGQSQAWHYSDIVKILQLAQLDDRERDWNKAIEVFLECCLAVNYLQPHDRREGWVVLRTSTADSAFLLSNLYGMKTGIAGFDELFGGGGLILADDILKDQPSPMGGRAILTVGRYGTGKSLLALQFAVEVARKGGLAYIMTVEQSPEECRYALGSVCALPPDDLVEIASTSQRIRRVLERPNPDRGALILTNPLRASFEDFLATFKTDLRDMNKYPIRLVVVDAVSAIPRYSKMLSELRNETLVLLQEAKSLATNIWLIAEEGTERLAYYENISDTVIRLSCEDVLPYSQRYFEITKSRFQREQRGRHPFSIQPGSGFSIFPSAAAVSARIQPRSVRPPDTPIVFGIPALDEILGDGALFAGDVIVLQGPTGTFKTPLGLLFLLGMDKPRGGYAKERTTESMLVSTAEDYRSTLHYILPGDQPDGPKKAKRISDIRPCPISGGYVKPGFILHKIEEEFLAARLAGGAIDRVMVDNVSHWGLSCPFVQEEKTFGDTIVELVRRHLATSLFTCNDLSDPNSSALQQAIVDAADCLIQFSRIEFRGSYHVMFRVLKTRGMKHRRESFELAVGEHTIDVKANSPLVRVSVDGRAEPMKIRLFLHNQTVIQQEENKRIVNTIKSIVSPHVSIETEVHDSGSLVKAWNLGTASALDELQVLQIDEFQLPDSLSYHNSAHRLPVHVFARNLWSAEWNDLLPRLKSRVQVHKGSFVGIPMYENVGLLAFRSDYRDSQGRSLEGSSCSWAALAEQCVEFESRSHDSLFFEFATGAKENYNCLFLEILLSFSAPRPPVRSIKPRLQDWLSEQAMSSVVVEVAKIFRMLTRRTHFLNKHRDSQPAAVHADRRAIVWRLWYSELTQMLANIEAAEKQSIRVSGLPKNVAVPGNSKTVSIAGEWYLTVPAYSAAQNVGLEIIKMLTTHDAELMRMRVGLGLPTRSSFYRPESEGQRLNDTVALDVRELETIVNHAFARSFFDSYSKLSNVFTLHLKRIIELPDQEEAALNEAIKDVFADFRKQANFVRY
jgi:KaiC/GvpD/RAD55 family RecA-like ATPase